MDAGAPRGGPVSLRDDVALLGQLVWTPRRALLPLWVLDRDNHPQVPRLGAGAAMLATERVGRWFGPDTQTAPTLATLGAHA